MFWRLVRSSIERILGETVRPAIHRSKSLIVGDDGESTVPFTLQDDVPQSFNPCHSESLRLGHVMVEEQLSLCVWASTGQKLVGFFGEAQVT